MYLQSAWVVTTKIANTLNCVNFKGERKQDSLGAGSRRSLELSKG